MDEGLGNADIVAAALAEHGVDMRQRREHVGDRRLRHGGRCLAVDGRHHLDVGIFGQYRLLRVEHVVVGRRTLHTAHLDDVPLAAEHLEHGFRLGRLVALEVEIELVVARRRSDRIEGDDDDACLAGLLDDAVDRGLRGGVDGEDIDLLQDQFGDLAVLLRDRAVAVHHYVVGDLSGGLRFLCRSLESLHHLVAPGVAVIGVGQRDDRRIR